MKRSKSQQINIHVKCQRKSKIYMPQVTIAQKKELTDISFDVPRKLAAT